MYRSLLLVSAILVLYCGTAFSSTTLYKVIDSLPTNNNADLLKKGKRQMTWGIASTVAGSVFLITAGSMAAAEVSDVFDPNSSGRNFSSAPDILGVFGLILLVVGIPLIIIGNKNKKKAATFSKIEKLDGVMSNNLAGGFSAFGIKIRIGK